MTFRARLTLWYVAVLTLLLALVAAGLLYALGRVAEKKFDAALWMVGAAEAENAAANVHQRGLERPDEQTVSNTRYRETLGYDQGPPEKYVTVIDDTGRVGHQAARTDRDRRRKDHRAQPARAFAGAGYAGPDRQARPRLQPDARAARDGLRRAAPLHRPRRPRAAHAADDH